MRSQAFSLPPFSRHQPGARPHALKGSFQAPTRTGSSSQERALAGWQSRRSTCPSSGRRRRLADRFSGSAASNYYLPACKREGSISFDSIESSAASIPAGKMESPFHLDSWITRCIVISPRSKEAIISKYPLRICLISC